jgi:hypothetical protein
VVVSAARTHVIVLPGGGYAQHAPLAEHAGVPRLADALF